MLRDEHIASLADQGFLVLKHVLPSDLTDGLRLHARTLFEGGAFEPAGVGAGRDHRLVTVVRSDQVYWWRNAPTDPIQARFLAETEHMRRLFNEAFYLGIQDVELHYAAYPEGSYYAKHLDRFRTNGRRKISMVLYLNDGWTAEDGGALRLYDPHGDGSWDILPEGGVLVLFRSDLVYHEVLPTRRTRLTLTGWFRSA